MNSKLFIFLFIFVASPVFAQWGYLGRPTIFTARGVFNHKDQAYASINGTLSMLYRASDNSIALFPVDRAITTHTVGASWGDYAITGTSTGLVFVFNDLNNGQKLISKNLISGEVKSLTTVGSRILMGTGRGLVISDDTLKTTTTITNGILTVPVNDIKVFPDVIYAATDSGVYYSTTNGLGWTRFSSSKRVANTVHRFDDTLYIGNSTGLYISADDGITWYRDSKFSDTEVFKLVETDGAFWLLDHNRVFKKTPGDEWAEVKLGIAGRYTGVVELGRATIISSVWGMGYKDEGSKWSSVSFQGNQFYGTITSLAIEGQNILAGTDLRGVFSSFDKGRTWTMTSPPFHRSAVYGIQTTFMTDGYWYASSMLGVYRSADSGQTWLDKSPVRSSVPTVNSFFKSGDTLWICTSSGLFYSMDFGDTWSASIIDTPNNIYAVVKTGSGRMLASGKESLKESYPPYEVWNESNLHPARFTFRMDQFGDTIYVSTGGDAVYRSFDGGGNWRKIAAGLENTYIVGLEINKDYAVIKTGMNDLFITSHKDTTWTSFLESTPPSFFGTFSIDNDTLYASESFGGLWKRALSDHEVITSAIISNLAVDYGVFPNPFHNVLSFKNCENIDFVVITDMAGRDVVSTVPTANLNLSFLANGIYFVKYFDKKHGVLVEKIIKE